MKTKDKELLQKMRTNMISIEFSEEETLMLHAVASLSDGRNSLTKLLHKRISPIAMKLIKDLKETSESLFTQKERRG